MGVQFIDVSPVAQLVVGTVLAVATMLWGHL